MRDKRIQPENRCELQKWLFANGRLDVFSTAERNTTLLIIFVRLFKDPFHNAIDKNLSDVAFKISKICTNVIKPVELIECNE